MDTVAICVENLTKEYRLGVVNHGTLRQDMESWWARLRGKPDPNSLLYSDQRLPGAQRFLALNNVSFSVLRGEVLGIIGRNGAGKSTLLKILSRITSPTRGKVMIKGQVASLLEVGTGFHPELTGRENIYLNGAMLGMSKGNIAMRFDEIVAFSGVEKFIDTPVKRYSSGMYVRLAFAVAAHLEPEILIVDEVLAVGDSAFQEKCLGKMGEVCREGRTILLVSHNLTSIQNLCSRTIVLDAGKLVKVAPSLEAIDYYVKSQSMEGIGISRRVDRQGNGLVKVVDIKIFNSNSEEANSFSMGEDFQVVLTLEGVRNNIIVGILIGNRMIQQILRGYTYESSRETLNINGRMTVKCRFHSPPLVHGVYGVHAWVGQLNECCDFVENAEKLVIRETDIFGTGKKMNPKDNICFAMHDWEFIG